MDAENVRRECFRILVKRGSRDNKNGGIDEESECEERDSEIEDGEFERVIDSFLRRHVILFIAAVFHGGIWIGLGELTREHADALIVLAKARLDNARAKVEAMRHDRRAKNAASLVYPGKS